MNKYINIIEGLLFLSGENGLTIGEIVSLLNLDELDIEDNLKEIEIEYQKDNHGIELIQTAQSYKFATKKEFASIFQKYAQVTFNENLPKSSVETLAIIAYNQPITRFQIEEIKGVSPNHSLQTLLNREIVHIVGKSSEIGHPNLYGTTDYFLDFIGINKLEDLPPLGEFQIKDEQTEQNELFNDYDDYKEIRKRLLKEVEFEVKSIELEDDIDIPELKLFGGEDEITEDDSNEK